MLQGKEMSIRSRLKNSAFCSERRGMEIRRETNKGNGVGAEVLQRGGRKRKEGSRFNVMVRRKKRVH